MLIAAAALTMARADRCSQPVAPQRRACRQACAPPLAPRLSTRCGVGPGADRAVVSGAVAAGGVGAGSFQHALIPARWRGGEGV
jgi:hypothetical protein